MNFALIKNSERELLKSIENQNKDDSDIWKIPNLLIPLGTIILALVSFVAFSEHRNEFLRYCNIILNGSLPLIAINQISAIGLIIFKFNKEKEESLGIKSTLNLRIKLLTYSIGILIFGTVFFAYQVISQPFQNVCLISFLIVLSGLLVWTSSYISKRIFLLQENFVEKTFDSAIRSEAKSTHGKGWGNG